MVTGLIGRKIGMTQLFAADGTVLPATVLKAGPCVVVQAKTVETDGYEAVQIGLVEEKPVKANKATTGHFKKAGVPPTRVRREVKVKAGGDPVKAGDQVSVSIFADGDRVDVIGTSRGKGFQGVVKRWNFSGQPATHGHMMHRRPGSIGCRLTPGLVWKNQKMPGHDGVERVTTQNLKVIQSRPEDGVLLISGAIPGNKGSIVVVRPAKKKPAPAAK